MKKKIAFFDFDKTIIKSDSMIDMLWFTLKLHPISCIPILSSIVKGLFKYIFSREKDISIVKEGVFYMLKYLNEEEIFKFSKYTLLEKKAFKNAIEEINLRKKQGYMIVMVSASAEIYLKDFYKLLNIDKIIGTQIDKEGNIVGENCKNIEKVNRINQWLEKEKIDINYEESCCYSDSFSVDKPMLELVKNRYLINSNRVLKEYSNLKWN